VPGSLSDGDDAGGAGAQRRDADEAAFRVLFQRHAAALLRYAQRLVRSRAAAEDVVQDVFFRVWMRPSGAAPMGNVRAYLYKVTRSRAFDYLTHERSEERRREELQVRGLSERGPILPPPDDPSAVVDEITHAVERVVRGMPPRQREVAFLRFREELTTAQIAARLGISSRTVEAHMACVTKTLREELPKLLAAAPLPPPSSRPRPPRSGE